ncbi:hypothetical protein DXG01_012605 [Tephrocybe rancida]|nr:hypothetical protein DXG01_012605 [Tephrocybe rancida]
MVAQIELALQFDIITKQALKSGKAPPAKTVVASQLDVSYDSFRDWIEAGTCLAFLAAAGTPYILLVIASVGLRAILSRRQNTSNEDIYDVAFRLRDPQDDALGRLIKKTLLPYLVDLRCVPMHHIQFCFVSDLLAGGVEVCYADDWDHFDRKFLEVLTMHVLSPPTTLCRMAASVGYNGCPPRLTAATSTGDCHLEDMPALR